jgi:gamma-glutamylcysteine synthetase
MNELEQTVATLATQFTNCFPDMLAGPRTVGREAEFPVVTATGEAADVRRLWELLLAEGDLREHHDSANPSLIVGLDGEDYNYELEVGVGTVEIVTRPCRDLFTVQRIIEEATERLVRMATRRGWQVLAYGVQPVTPPNLPLMAPKQRYQSLYRAMGAEWLWYTVTASDQCHVAIARGEALEMLNFGNLMAPVLIALCANSPVYAGKLSPFCSGREGEMARIDAHEYRHGMPVRPFTSFVDYVNTVSQATYLIHRADNMVIPTSRPFTDYLMEHGPDFAAFLFHEHYLWNSARVRTAYGTLELRPACQQPWAEHMAAMALSVGLIEAATPIMAYVVDVLGQEYWSILRAYHRQSITYGLAAAQPSPDFLITLVRLAERGLKQRGQGEEYLLLPIFDRLYRRQNPAQRARAIFQNDQLSGLLAHTAMRPGALRHPTSSILKTSA